MSQATLVLPESITDELAGAASEEWESAAVLLVSVTGQTRRGLRLLGRELAWVPPNGYLRREADSLTIASDGYVDALRRAETIGASAIWVHTHPGEGASPAASRFDDAVDRELAEVFKVRTGSEFYGALIVSHNRGEFTFTGWLENPDGVVPIHRLWAVGDRLTLRSAYDLPLVESLPAMFDRNVRAFGGDVQVILRDLQVAVVGCGGTGSSVAEQLTRLGVRRLLLIDPDVLSETNLTRVYGSRPVDVGRAKADVLGAHLRSIAPDVAVESIQSLVTIEATARELTDCDVVFGCTDDNAGRLVLSRLSSYYLTPVIDCGVLITGDSQGRISGIDARATVLTPGSACLVCRSRVDLQRAATELLTPDERRRREDEGYAPALLGVEPAVVAYTTLIAAAAVGELLERLIGYGPEPVPGEILIRCHEREFSTNVQAPRPGHYCDPESGKLGLGDMTPFLEQTWVA